HARVSERRAYRVGPAVRKPGQEMSAPGAARLILVWNPAYRRPLAPEDVAAEGPTVGLAPRARRLHVLLAALGAEHAAGETGGAPGGSRPRPPGSRSSAPAPSPPPGQGP